MEGQECIHKIRIRCAWFRKTGDKQIIQQGSWAVLGMEIECVLLHLLPSVPSIAFDQQHKPFLFFDALAIKLCHGVMKKQIKNTQCWPICPIHDKLHKRITVLIRVEGVRHHLWLHYPSTFVLVPFWIIITRSSSLHQRHKKTMNDWTWISKTLALRIC